MNQHDLQARPMTMAQPGVAILFVICLLTPVVAASIESARMRLPEEFGQQSAQLRFTGFGGYNKGTWSIGDYQGEFTRGESRLGVFDPLLVSSKGKSSFSFPASGSDAPLTADCEMRKKSVTIGVLTFDPKKMAYDCEFRRNGTLTGDRFILGQPKRTGLKDRLLAQDTRVGEAMIAGSHFTMKSVHQYHGSPISSQSPVGYLVDAAEQTIGAIELTDWNPAIYIQDTLQPDTQDALLVVALAIAVLRDPANSALEE